MKNIDEITKQLEEGVKDVFESGKYTAYLDFMASFHNYSINNTVLIFQQMPSASMVAGFQAWKQKYNRHVKKGERGINILAPIPHKFTREVEKENGEKVQEEISYTTFRAVTVFDVSQTEGKELPSLAKRLSGSVANYEKLLADLIKLSPFSVCFENIAGGANGYCSYAENKIAVKNELSEQQTIKTVIHEIAHAILHSQEGIEANAEHNAKEVEAESVAYIVSSAFGLDTSDYSFGYVAGWSGNKDVKELTDSMEVIKATALQIIKGVEGSVSK